MPVGICQCQLDMLERLVVELAAQVVVGHGAASGVAGNRHAFEYRVRIEAQDVAVLAGARFGLVGIRSEEHTSELQSLMRISYAVFCLKKKTRNITLSLI